MRAVRSRATCWTDSSQHGASAHRTLHRNPVRAKLLPGAQRLVLAITSFSSGLCIALSLWSTSQQGADSNHSRRCCVCHFRLVFPRHHMGRAAREIPGGVDAPRRTWSPVCGQLRSRRYVPMRRARYQRRRGPWSTAAPALVDEDASTRILHGACYLVTSTSVRCALLGMY